MCGVTVVAGGSLRDSTGGGTVKHELVGSTHRFIITGVPIESGATVDGVIGCNTFVGN